MITSFQNGQNLLNIYSSSNDFLIDTFDLPYSSGKYLTWASNNHSLLLYDKNLNGLIVWWATQNGETFTPNLTLSNEAFLGIIPTSPEISSGIINGSIDYKTLKNYKGKLYMWCPIFENTITTLSGGTIFEMNTTCLKSRNSISPTPDTKEKIIFNF